jgi:hypothetical protein
MVDHPMEEENYCLIPSDQPVNGMENSTSESYRALLCGLSYLVYCQAGLHWILGFRPSKQGLEIR